MQLSAFVPPQPDGHPIAAALRQAVLDQSNLAPRSLQRALGPSEYGEPCSRRLAYRLMDEPKTNTDSDPWASIVGTATHAWLADALLADNERSGELRWLVERRLEVRPGLEGSCDAYDVRRHAVVDHKVVGPSKLREYKISGPSEQYRKQVHIYGKGYRRLGLPVREVAIAFYPRAGQLSGMHVWSEPFNEAIADETIARVDTVLQLVVEMDVEHHPEHYKAIPRQPGRNCLYCPWMRPGPDTGRACPGDTQLPAAPPAVA
jgi:hypothetical protein